MGDVKAHLCATLETHSDTDGAFCPCSRFILSIFVKAYGYGTMEQYLQ